jgi:hypothetical protein
LTPKGEDAEDIVEGVVEDGISLTLEKLVIPILLAFALAASLSLNYSFTSLFLATSRID